MIVKVNITDDSDWQTLIIAWTLADIQTYHNYEQWKFFETYSQTDHNSSAK